MAGDGDWDSDLQKDPGAGSGRFEATEWTMVMRARDQSTLALNNLFTRYRRPLLSYLQWKVRGLAHLQAKGRALGSAEDLLQGFCEAMLRRDFLQKVSSNKGRFRTFILRALDRFILDEIAKVQAGVGGGGFEHRSTGEQDDDGRPQIDPATPQRAPDLEFDRAFAVTLLGNAMRRLSDEYRQRGRSAVCQALEPILFQDENAPAYRDLSATLGMEEQALRTTASRMRAELRKIFEDEVLQTVAQEEDWKEECHYLRGLFAR